MPITRIILSAAIALTLAGGSSSASERAVFLFFWAAGCPHCEQARPFVKQLEKEHPKLRFESWEVLHDDRGRRRFAQEVKRLGIKNPVVPTFVCGNEYVLGFMKGASESSLRELARRCT